MDVHDLKNMNYDDAYIINNNGLSGTIMRFNVGDNEDEWLLYEHIDDNTKIFYGTYQITELDTLIRDSGIYGR